MQYSNKYLKTNFSRENYKGGMLFIKRCPVNYPITDVLMLDSETPLPTGFEVNYDKYYHLFVEDKLKLLCNEFEELFNKNTSLKDFIT